MDARERIKSDLRALSVREAQAVGHWKIPEHTTSPLVFKEQIKSLFRIEQDGQLSPFETWAHWPDKVPILPLLMASPRLSIEFLPKSGDEFFAFYGVTPSQFLRLAEKRLIIPSVYAFRDRFDDFREHATVLEEYPSFFDQKYGWRINDIRRVRMLQARTVGDTDVAAKDLRYFEVALRLLDARTRDAITRNESFDGALAAVQRNLMYVQAFSEFQAPIAEGLMSRDRPPATSAEAAAAVALLWAQAEHAVQYTSTFGETQIVPMRTLATRLEDTFGSVSKVPADELFPRGRFVAERLFEHFRSDLRTRPGAKWGELDEPAFLSLLDFLVDAQPLVSEANDALSFGPTSHAFDPEKYYQKLSTLLSEALKLRGIGESLGPYVELTISALIGLALAGWSPLPEIKKIALASGITGGLIGSGAIEGAKLSIAKVFSNAMNHEKRRILAFDDQLARYARKKRE